MQSGTNGSQQITGTRRVAAATGGYDWRAGGLAAWWLVLLFSPLGIVAGCQEAAPTLETYVVTGTVQFRNGDPVQSGTIDFRSKRDQRISMSAEILEDGSFELETLHENQNLPGAVAGPCSAIVTIFIPGNPIPLIVDLPKTYDVKSENNNFPIKLKLPSPQRRSN